MKTQEVDLLILREALEASWQTDTAYLFVNEAGNPALGQCYVTSRVIQHFFPEAEIIEGQVETISGPEKHFWNYFNSNEQKLHIDLTWQQFPPASRVKSWKIRDRDTLNDGSQTIERFEKLLSRVEQVISKK